MGENWCESSQTNAKSNADSKVCLLSRGERNKKEKRSWENKSFSLEVKSSTQ